MSVRAARGGKRLQALSASLLCSLALTAQTADAQESVQSDDAETTTYRATAVVARRKPPPAAPEPRNVQQVQTTAVSEHALGVHDALEARSASVVASDAQGNPLQPDVSYRGFVASPVLGMAQGLAVYQNDVRINEPFGDVVLWDLVPDVAVAQMQLAPAGEPAYGRGALGGSLVLRTKTAFDARTTQLSALGGSFARYQVEAESGRVHDRRWGAYVAASIFGEQGFRDESPSSAQRFYTDLRRRDAGNDYGVQLTLGASELRGNGPAPVDLLRDEGRRAVYTFPDTSRSALVMVAADAERTLSERLMLHGNAYVRHLGRETENGDEAEFEACAGNDLICDEDGEPLRDESGRSVPADLDYDGLYNTTDSDAFGYGARAGMRISAPLAARESDFRLGVTFDGAQIDYLQRAELGLVTPERGVLRKNVYLAGDELHTKLAARNRSLGAYVQERWAPWRDFSVSVGAYLDVTHVELDDREGTALDGAHTFARLNPSVGLAYTLRREITLFASYAESNRVPSASELACADPGAPCRLPNAFVADPPLAQVVGRSVEIGARGRFGAASDTTTLRWSLAGFGARNQDDIVFVAGPRVGTGYFRNAGNTQRVGLEADLDVRAGIVGVFAGYTLLRATFESALRLPSQAHPRARSGVIAVRPGDRIPGLPMHVAKAGIRLQPTRDWTLGVSTAAYAERGLRGDEGNQLAPLGAYATVDAETRYALFDGLSVFAKGQNLLDAEYETFGVVADPGEVLASASDPRFVTPGAPLAVWVGITVREP